MAERKIIVLNDAGELYVRAAEEIAHIAGESICTHGEFSICLSGGLTPAATYELLATRFHLSVDWKELQFFWGDERCVPPDDPESNFAMVNRTMLSKLGLRSEQVHRMRGEDDPANAARAYEEELRSHFGVGEGEFPRFDLILLGLGDNRHTASLFPGDAAIHETQRLVAAVEVDAVPRRRLTLTPPVINHAQRVMFLVAGQNKAAAVKDVLEGPCDADKYPAQIVAPLNGEVIWMLDKAAASLLANR
ncbi:MAG: 6-phosphogluconolactonase [Candidatus Binatus sp.]|uniref:6-phosphogluconolactonase n=1 Tax=Candidatus Binatus sp. TaxID=2811406 RepID=UPI00271922D1|nr:6-phosphogluconolactonase [Candidatus Binatus sp.]MDO8433889.1 6-phosphogluconolactonase [Candidatus Binatus sp.]